MMRRIVTIVILLDRQTTSLLTCAGKQDLRPVWWCILMRRRQE